MVLEYKNVFFSTKYCRKHALEKHTGFYLMDIW